MTLNIRNLATVAHLAHMGHAEVDPTLAQKRRVYSEARKNIVWERSQERHITFKDASKAVLKAVSETHVVQEISDLMKHFVLTHELDKEVLLEEKLQFIAYLGRLEKLVFERFEEAKSLAFALRAARDALQPAALEASLVDMREVLENLERLRQSIEEGSGALESLVATIDEGLERLRGRQVVKSRRERINAAMRKSVMLGKLNRIALRKVSLQSVLTTGGVYPRTSMEDVGKLTSVMKLIGKVAVSKDSAAAADDEITSFFEDAEQRFHEVAVTKRKSLVEELEMLSPRLPPQSPSKTETKQFALRAVNRAHARKRKLEKAYITSALSGRTYMLKVLKGKERLIVQMDNARQKRLRKQPKADQINVQKAQLQNGELITAAWQKDQRGANHKEEPFAFALEEGGMKQRREFLHAASVQSGNAAQAAVQAAAQKRDNSAADAATAAQRAAVQVTREAGVHEGCLLEVSRGAASRTLIAHAMASGVPLSEAIKDAQQVCLEAGEEDRKMMMAAKSARLFGMEFGVYPGDDKEMEMVRTAAKVARDWHLVQGHDLKVAIQKARLSDLAQVNAESPEARANVLVEVVSQVVADQGTSISGRAEKGAEVLLDLAGIIGLPEALAAKAAAQTAHRVAVFASLEAGDSMAVAAARGASEALKAARAARADPADVVVLSAMATGAKVAAAVVAKGSPPSSVAKLATQEAIKELAAGGQSKQAASISQKVFENALKVARQSGDCEAVDPEMQRALEDSKKALPQEEDLIRGHAAEAWIKQEFSANEQRIFEELMDHAGSTSTAAGFKRKDTYFAACIQFQRYMEDSNKRFPEQLGRAEGFGELNDLLQKLAPDGPGLDEEILRRLREGEVPDAKVLQQAVTHTDEDALEETMEQMDGLFAELEKSEIAGLRGEMDAARELTQKATNLLEGEVVEAGDAKTEVLTMLEDLDMLLGLVDEEDRLGLLEAKQKALLALAECAAAEEASNLPSLLAEVGPSPSNMQAEVKRSFPAQPHEAEVKRSFPAPIRRVLDPQEALRLRIRAHGGWKMQAATDAKAKQVLAPVRQQRVEWLRDSHPALRATVSGFNPRRRDRRLVEHTLKERSARGVRPWCVHPELDEMWEEYGRLMWAGREENSFDGNVVQKA
eukprot:TRINITY_DN7651_c0_g1_i1.p1 TRINITY_DN7651_c0_g1~~TRINITY_DN7651_c0_g1_i1.p1  ORF type:complete len:1135 (-),score=274.54 TRINITY_DN7651_c0_g1_i1:101-3505(-)